MGALITSTFNGLSKINPFRAKTPAAMNLSQ